jgi:hypothetical protein
MREGADEESAGCDRILGSYRCYLNVPREEAIRRYKDHYRRMKESDRG